VIGPGDLPADEGGNKTAEDSAAPQAGPLPDWCRVYEGLTEQQVAECFGVRQFIAAFFAGGLGTKGVGFSAVSRGTKAAMNRRTPRERVTIDSLSEVVHGGMCHADPRLNSL